MTVTPCLEDRKRIVPYVSYFNINHNTRNTQASSIINAVIVARSFSAQRRLQQLNFNCKHSKNQRNSLAHQLNEPTISYFTSS